MTDVIEFKELFMIAVEKLREETSNLLLEADATYKKDSENEGITEIEYLQSDLIKEQRKACNYATHSYIAGRYDVFRIITVLFLDKWDTDNIRKLFAAKINN